MIELSVSDVRAKLWSALRDGDRGDGQSANLLLGRIFHSTFADLVSAKPERSGLRVIVETGPSREARIEAVRRHAWRSLVAPSIHRHAAELQTKSEPTRNLWRAVCELSRWLVDVVDELMKKTDTTAWEQLTELLRAEVPLQCELKEPDWEESVVLYGVADSVLRLPQKNGFCAIELKLGKAAPPVDLGQAALYRLMLTRNGQEARSGALALLRFGPELEETLIQAEALESAERRLLDLIAALANVRRAAKLPVGGPVSSQAVSSQAVSSQPAPPQPVTEGPRSEGPYAEIKRRLIRACGQYAIGIEIAKEPDVGPRFLRFSVRLKPGQRLDNLQRRMPEIALQLNIVQPIVTQEAGALFIDVAREDPQNVPFLSIVPQLASVDPLIGSARMPIGVDSSGRLRDADLASAGRSHALVAGTTGSGKSEWLRSALAGLLLTNTPETLRIITVDPKLVAFMELEKSDFLWKRNAWFIPEPGRDVTDLFQDLIEEMERRYQLTRESGSDNLAEHVRKTQKPLPRLVLFCDEYFSLVHGNKETKATIEESVSYLGAKARAAGIHLVLATQHPSRSIISGTIATNLPCRVALKLPSHIESNMILGTKGAELLTSYGDLLYKDFGNPQRLQAPYLSSEERQRIFTTGRM